MVVFCNINPALVDIIKEEAGERKVVDCGCGEAELYKKMPFGKVVPIDIFYRGDPNVMIMDCRDFMFRKEHMPTFIRPCHSGFVEETLMRAYPLVESALYIGLRENLEDDLGVFTKLAIPIHDEWEGDDSEKVWRIPFTKHYART
jgi:hypothetical protein